MALIPRRTFLQYGGAAMVAATGLTDWTRQAAGADQAAASPNRKFTMDLVCGAIGVGADQPEAIRLAQLAGFESVAPSAPYLADLSDALLDDLLADLKAKHLAWGAAGLPAEFRRDEARFQEDLERLPRLAKGLQRAGVTRVGTWISPRHQELTYVQNFRQHAVRLREIAKVLGDCGLRFGLEYVGTKTLWTAERFPFIHTMAETKDLLTEIDRPNVGFVLDSWHWYTASETVADLGTLTNQDVVACDLNDAPAGIPVEEQMDNARELPAATGVIDVRSFLGALIGMGYDGPVRAEPFNRELNALENEPAVLTTAAAMKKALSLIDAKES